MLLLKVWCIGYVLLYFLFPGGVHSRTRISVGENFSINGISYATHSRKPNYIYVMRGGLIEIH